MAETSPRALLENEDFLLTVFRHVNDEGKRNIDLYRINGADRTINIEEIGMNWIEKHYGHGELRVDDYGGRMFPFFFNDRGWVAAEKILRQRQKKTFSYRFSAFNWTALSAITSLVAAVAAIFAAYFAYVATGI